MPYNGFSYKENWGNAERGTRGAAATIMGCQLVKRLPVVIRCLNDCFYVPFSLPMWRGSVCAIGREGRRGAADAGLGCGTGTRLRRAPHPRIVPAAPDFHHVFVAGGGCGATAGAAAGRLQTRWTVPIARTSFFRSKAPPSDIEPNEMQPKSQFLLPLCDLGYISPGSPTKSIFSSTKMAPQARAHRRDAIEVTFRFNEVQP